MPSTEIQNTEISATIPSIKPGKRRKNTFIESSYQYISDINTKVTEIELNLETFYKFYIKTKKLFDSLQSTIKKEQKLIEKQLNKEKKKEESKKQRCLNGFAKPSSLSTELCSFLNMPEGSKMARTEVTSHINSYIKKNNLENPKNKKIILPNNELSILLSELEDKHKPDGYTYFNLQKYLKHHYLLLMFEFFLFLSLNH